MTTPLVARLRRAGCVFAEEEAALLLAAFPDPADLDQAVRRREVGELIEHILGRATFCGNEVEQARGVFVPRARAEPLARHAVTEAARRGPAPRVLDLGCGSGAIAAAVAHAAPAAFVDATDVSRTAVATARRNGDRFGFRVHLGDWFDGLPERLAGRFDVVVAYLPHTPDAALQTLPRDRRAGEGRLGFAGGADGLDPLRAVLLPLPRWLATGGVFLTLVADEQVDAAGATARARGWTVGTEATGDDVVLALTGA